MLKAGRIHVMAGPAKGDAARQTFVQNLQAAADSAPQQQFTIEPLNNGDFPGYFLDDYNLAADILDEVVRVEGEARLFRMSDRTVVATRRFEADAPAQDNRVSAIVSAFSVATDQYLVQLVEWTRVRTQSSSPS